MLRFLPLGVFLSVTGGGLAGYGAGRGSLGVPTGTALCCTDVGALVPPGASLRPGRVPAAAGNFPWLRAAPPLTARLSQANPI
jgi:hypothetical protein